MKRILIILISFISFVVVFADEKPDSVNSITSHSVRLFYESSKSTINAYRQMAGDVSRDTTFAQYLMDFAKHCYSIGELEEAIQAMTEASKIEKTVFGSNNHYYAAMLSYLSVFYSDLGNYDEAIRLGIEALVIMKRSLGTNHQDYATTLVNLADCYKCINKYDEAIQLTTEALEIFKMRQGMDNRFLITTLYNLTIYYFDIGNYDEAFRSGREVLEIMKKTHGTDHQDYVTMLTNLAYYYSDLGNYGKAIQLGNEALEIKKRALGTDHPDYATSLGNLANYYSHNGNYVEAIQLGNEALEITKRTLGPNHQDYATVLGNLANYYSQNGNYVEAIQLGNEALEIKKRALGTDHPDYAKSLGSLANTYTDLGNHGKAIQLGNEALEIIKRALGTDHPDYTMALTNLAYYYSDLGNYGKAIQLGNEALEIKKRVFGTNHPEYATVLSNLASCYSHNGNYIEAIRLITEALEITKRTLGIDHPDYARLLSNLAYYYSDLGNYGKAIQLGNEALEITKRTLGPNHQDYATVLGNLANYYSQNGNYVEAIQQLNTYVLISRKNVLTVFSGLTANERQMYWDKYRFTFNEWMPRVVIHSEGPGSGSFLYNNVALFSKGLLLSTELEMAKLIHESGDEEAEQMYSELRQNRQILNVQYSKPIAERYIGCDSLERVSAELERKLVSRVEEFGDFTRNLSITWKDVQSKLNDSDIAIEFLSYPENDSTTACIALTLCKNDTTPLLTPLFTESQLRAVEGGDHTYQNVVADSLIWGDLAYRLEGKSRVYFSAAGMLHGIGIEYLPSMEGKECYRLSSTRELVTHKRSEAIKSSTLFGGIDYDATYASIKTSAPSSTPGELSAPNTILYAENTEAGPIIYKQGGRGGFDEYNSMRTMRYSVRPLPGSRKEIQDISALLKESKFNVHDCDTITRNQASEESFKILSGQRRSLIHISTHGFYYDVDEAENKGEHLRMMLMGDDRPSRSEDKSLLRCGLCFAGANQFLREMKNPADGQDEGILNALEIAQTDLRGLDLVVLSACQTALGDVVNGEGVFGLQRGFKKAGAQSILMSLWEVDDDITALLMTEFYKAWTSGMTKAGALKAAQDVVKEKYPNPHDWAGFILLDALD